MNTNEIPSFAVLSYSHFSPCKSNKAQVAYVPSLLCSYHPCFCFSSHHEKLAGAKATVSAQSLYHERGLASSSCLTWSVVVNDYWGGCWRLQFLSPTLIKIVPIHGQNSYLLLKSLSLFVLRLLQLGKQTHLGLFIVWGLRSPVFVRRAISSRLIIYPSPTILKSQVAAHQVSLLH